MKQKSCCHGSRFRPHILGVVAGLIMVIAGIGKFLGGKATLTYV